MRGTLLGEGKNSWFAASTVGFMLPVIFTGIHDREQSLSELRALPEIPHYVTKKSIGHPVLQGPPREAVKAFARNKSQETNNLLFCVWGGWLYRSEFLDG